MRLCWCGLRRPFGQWPRNLIIRKGLDGFIICDRILNSACIHEEHYEAVALALAKEDRRQNIIYQELHLDYPLNEEWGLPLEVVMGCYRSAHKKAQELYNVEIVHIAELDRTLISDRCLSFLKPVESYLDTVAGLGMDCEKKRLSLCKAFVQLPDRPGHGPAPDGPRRRGRWDGEYLGCYFKTGRPADRR